MTQEQNPRPNRLLKRTAVQIGREEELARVQQALTDSSINVVSIYGPAGYGKTSLAQSVALWAESQDQFTGRVVWVTCHVRNSLPEILLAIADALGINVEVSPSRNLRSLILSRLQSNPTLLILDEYEAIAEDDEVLAFVGRLPLSTKTLVVGRERIRLPGRQIEVRLEHLSELETAEFLRHSLTAEQWKEIDKVVLRTLHRRTLGIPSALQLVAALLDQNVSVATVLRLLDTNTEALSILATRLTKETVRLHSGVQVHLLQALSVFDFPVDIHAIQAVSVGTDWSEFRKTVSRLSVVQVMGDRYTLHPVVRDAIRDSLTPEDLSRLQHRMVHYYLAYAQKYQDDFDRLNRDWQNIRYALEVAFDNELWSEFIDIILAVAPFFDMRGDDDVYQQLLDRAIRVSAWLGDSRRQASLLHNLGVRYQRRGELSAALEAYHQSLRVNDEIGDQLRGARTFAQIGTIYSQQQQLLRAKEYLRLALEMCVQLGDREGQSRLLGNLALVHMQVRDYEEARQLLEQALSISETLGNRQTQASLLGDLGSLYREQGRYEEAKQLLEQALSIKRILADVRSEASLLSNLGSIFRELGRREEALRLFEQALSITRALADTRTEASVLSSLGSIYRELGSYEEALRQLEEGLLLARRTGDRQTEAIILANQGRVYCELPGSEETGGLQRGLNLLGMALTLSREIGDRQREASILGNLGEIYTRRTTGNVKESFSHALDFYDRALQLASKETHPTLYARLNNNLGNLYASLPDVFGSENIEKAITHYQEALTVYALETFPSQWAETHLNLAEVHRQRLSGDREANLRQAIASYQQALHVYTDYRVSPAWLRATTNLSISFAEVGNWDLARNYAEQVLQVFRGAPLDSELLEILLPWYQCIGEMAIRYEDIECAAQILAEAAQRLEFHGEHVPDRIRNSLIDLRRRLGDDRFVIIWAEVQGILTPILGQTIQDARYLMGREQFEQATEQLTAIIDMLSDSGQKGKLHLQLATVLFLRGLCLRKRGLWEKALVDQERSFKLFGGACDYIGQAHALLEIGQLFELMNNYEDARLYYLDAYRFYRKGDDKRGMAVASENLGKLEYRVRMFPQAIANLEEARVLYILLGDHVKAASIEVDLEDAKVSLAYHVARVQGRDRENGSAAQYPCN